MSSFSFSSLAFVCLVLSNLASAQETVPELKQARDLYEKEVEFVERPIRDRYLSKLESLKRTLGAQGNARGAFAIQQEIDRVRSITGSSVAFAKFTGVWRVDYDNGFHRRYAIKADGSVQVEDDQGQPIAGQKGKLTTENGDYLLEVEGENKIERLVLSGELFNLEHFNPKETYPSGQPVAHGKGAKVSNRP